MTALMWACQKGRVEIVKILLAHGADTQIEDYWGQKAIDLNNAGAMVNLGLLYENGSGVPRDHARAAQLYQQSCEGGAAAGCHNLAVMYENGDGVAQDRDKAESFHEQACDLGEASSCTLLGRGQERRAFRLFELGCENGDLLACANYGLYLAQGIGTKADRERGVDLLRKACNAGSDRGCAKLKELGESPSGAPPAAPPTAPPPAAPAPLPPAPPPARAP